MLGECDLTLDQTNKADKGKVRMDLLLSGMPDALEHVAAVLTYGAEKYEEHGWRKVDPKRYRDAKGRHILAQAKGEDYDDESGLLHAAHEVCNAMFNLQMKIEELGGVKPKWNKPPTDHKESV